MHTKSIKIELVYKKRKKFQGMTPWEPPTEVRVKPRMSPNPRNAPQYVYNLEHSSLCHFVTVTIIRPKNLCLCQPVCERSTLLRTPTPTPRGCASATVCVWMCGAQWLMLMAASKGGLSISDTYIIMPHISWRISYTTSLIITFILKHNTYKH